MARHTKNGRTHQASENVVYGFEDLNPINMAALLPAIKWQSEVHDTHLKEKHSITPRLATIFRKDWNRAAHSPEQHQDTIFWGKILTINHSGSGYVLACNGFGHSGKRQTFLEDFIIDPKALGKGWGSRLFNAVAKTAIEKEIFNVAWETDKTNDNFIRWNKEHFNWDPTQLLNYSFSPQIEVEEVKSLQTRAITSDDAELLKKLVLPNTSAEYADTFPITGFLTLNEDGAPIAATFCTLNCSTFDPEIYLTLEQTYYEQDIYKDTSEETNALKKEIAQSVTNAVTEFCTDPEVRTQHTHNPANKNYLEDLNIRSVRWHVYPSQPVEDFLISLGAKKYTIRENDRRSLMVPYHGDFQTIIEGTKDRVEQLPKTSPA